jgi:hypothetical protein
MSMDLREQLEYDLANPDNMVEQITYLIFGAVITTTRGFAKVEINVSEETKRIFIKVHLKWMVNTKRMKKIHDIWLRRAELNIKEYVPDGYRALIYYEGLGYDKN